MLESDEREPNEVLTVIKCQNEEYLAVLSGKNLIMAEQKVNQLWIFRKKSNHGNRDSYEQHKRIIVKDMPEFGKTCIQFHFRAKEGLERDELIFAKKDEIIVMNFETSSIRTIYNF